MAERTYLMLIKADSVVVYEIDGIKMDVGNYKDYLNSWCINKCRFNEIETKLKIIDGTDVFIHYTSENDSRNGEVSVQDFLTILQEANERHNKESEEDWYRQDFLPIIERVEALVRRKIISLDDFVKFETY